jgi:hypothetical protein
MSIPKATRRFFNEHRVMRDPISCGVVGFEIPAADDPRTRRVRMRGEGSGFLVEHTDRNRARRRDLSRDYALTGMMRGSNKPYVKPIPEKPMSVRASQMHIYAEGI